VLPSDRDILESLNREGSFNCSGNCSGSIQTNPTVRIMYIMLNNDQTANIPWIQNSAVSRMPSMKPAGFS